MRSVLLCIFFLIFFTGFGQSITENSHSPCGDSSWVAYKDEKCFKLIDEFVIHDNAEKVCNKQRLLTDPSIPTLVSIKSTDEQKYLNKLLFEQKQIMETIWIAAIRSKENNLFLWNDNSLLNHSNWAEGSPINEAERDCVEMRSPNAIRFKRNIPRPSINVTDGKWFNVLCKKRNLVLCQKLQTWTLSQLRKTLLDTRKELSETKYQFDNAKNQFELIFNEYFNDCSLSKRWSTCKLFNDLSNNRKILAIPRSENEKYGTYEKSKQICNKYMASLVAIESKEKQLVVKEFLLQFNENFWLSGLRDYNGILRWMNNGNIFNYTNWQPGEPNNGNGNEDCVHIYGAYADFRWNDGYCQTLLRVVCEFSLNI